jgi:uncharacterized protein (DUF1778 family)
MTIDQERSRTARDSRLNVRATSDQEQLIRRAAAAVEKSVTDFVLGSATAEAERVLADRRWFLLDEDQWERFMVLLDAPVEDDPKLRKLLTEPTVFDER